jgi:hypothetical protein
LAPDSALGLDGSDASDAPPSATDDGTVASEGGTGDDATGGSVDADADASDVSDASDVLEAAVTQPSAMPTIAAGAGFACRIDGTGAVWCWGDDVYGQTGSAPTAVPVAHPTVVAGLAGATALALGDHHACAVTTSGTAYCWGLNDAYQLGHAAASSGDQICPTSTPGQTAPCSPTPTLVDGVSGAVAIASAGAWTCALLGNGTVQCWGAVQSTPTPDGGIPCGTATQPQGRACYPAPYAVAATAGMSALAVGYDHACSVLRSTAAPDSSLDAGNQVACWGDNNEGQVAPSACPASDCTTPVTRADLPATTALAVGNTFTCALGTDGTVRCFGDNAEGELGHAPGTAGDVGPPGDSAAGTFNASPQPAVPGA